MAKRAESTEAVNDSASKILEAADQLLAEVGHEGMSMQAVADAADVNKALLFYYFKSKSGLIEKVLERYYAGHLAALSAAFQSEGTTAERLHRLTDAYLDYIEANARYPRLVQHQVLAGGDQRQLVQRNLQPLYEWVVGALAELAPQDGPAAARQLFVTFSGMVINYFTVAPLLAPVWGGDPLSPDGLKERRAHLHWVVDALLAKLESGA